MFTNVINDRFLFKKMIGHSSNIFSHSLCLRKVWIQTILLIIFDLILFMLFNVSNKSPIITGDESFL